MAKVFIANRGEVSVRIIRACHKLGLECVVAFSEADRGSLPTRLADGAVCVGPPRPSDSYLNKTSLISAAVASGCDAVHPGYGFLAESTEFAQSCIDNGLIFIGPPPDVLRLMGDKSMARKAAQDAGIPVLPGTGPVDSLDDFDVEGIGYPLMVKAVAGGGGRGIRLAASEGDLEEIFMVAQREAQAAFGDGRLYLEKFIPRARHLEVQIVADGHGNVIHLGERECSVQRRHQKVLEEAPALIGEVTRRYLWENAVGLARSINYVSVGTVEFIYDDATQEVWFIEMNPRLQVEHGVSEMITELDLVCQQVRIAYGEALFFEQEDVLFSGHALEWRITAESVADGLMPRSGTISKWVVPELPGVRVDTHCFEGYTVPPFYDSLLAKLIVHGPTRDEAIARLRTACMLFGVQGVPTTLDLCRTVIEDRDFVGGGVSTTWLDGVLEGLMRQGDVHGS